MGRPCSICTNPSRREIDRAVVSGSSYRQVAQLFCVGATSVLRHKRDHIPKLLAAAEQEASLEPDTAHHGRELVAQLQAQSVQYPAHGRNLLGLVEGLLQRSIGLLSRAEAQGDIRAAAQMIRETRGCLELLARMQAEVHPYPTPQSDAQNSFDDLPERKQLRIRQFAQELLLDPPPGSLARRPPPSYPDLWDEATLRRSPAPENSEPESDPMDAKELEVESGGVERDALEPCPVACTPRAALPWPQPSSHVLVQEERGRLVLERRHWPDD